MLVARPVCEFNEPVNWIALDVGTRPDRAHGDVTAGLIACGDPAVALRLVNAEEHTRRDLVLFATSDEFYALRAQL